MKNIALENNVVKFKTRYDLPEPEDTDEITLQNYSSKRCPKCGSMLWLQSALAFVPQGIAKKMWTYCVTSPKCDFSVVLSPWPWEVVDKESVVGSAPGSVRISNPPE